MTEVLDKALHDLDTASGYLRAALHDGGAVEAIVLIPIIGRVAVARNDVSALIAARATDAADAKSRRP